MFAFKNGKFIDENDLVVPIKSKVVQYGLGTFEGIRAYWNPNKQQLYIFRTKDHYKRLLDSCKIFRLKSSFSIDELISFTVDLLRRNEIKQNCYIRPLFYHGSTKIAPVFEDNDTEFALYCTPMEDYMDKANGIDACISSWQRVPEIAIPARAKPTGLYLNSALARDEAIRNGFSEAIFLTKNGYVSEGTGEHIFLIKNNHIVTPPSTEDNLDGITRNTLIKIIKEELNYEVEVRQIGRSELYIADELFFCGTGAEVIPIKSVDRRLIANGGIGSMTEKIQSVYLNLVKGNIPKHQEWLTKVY